MPAPSSHGRRPHTVNFAMLDLPLAEICVSGTMMSLRGNRALFDVLIIGLLILPIFIAAVYFDAFDLVAGFAIEHEPLDEALLAIPVVGLLGFVYGLRRIADLRQEVTRRREAELRFDA